MINEETWNWVRTAPLPVVLAISLTLSGFLGVWALAMEKEQNRHSTQLAVAAKNADQATQRSDQAVAAATAMDSKLEKVNDKLDRLMNIVLELRADKRAAEKGKK